MRIKRQDILAAFERDFVLDRCIICYSAVNVFQTLRQAWPHEDRCVIEEIAAELSAMGNWVPRELNIRWWCYATAAC
jgi:hypothetical protein